MCTRVTHWFRKKKKKEEEKRTISLFLFSFLSLCSLAGSDTADTGGAGGQRTHCGRAGAPRGRCLCRRRQQADRRCVCAGPNMQTKKKKRKEEERERRKEEELLDSHSKLVLLFLLQHIGRLIPIAWTFYDCSRWVPSLGQMAKFSTLEIKFFVFFFLSFFFPFFFRPTPVSI